jgi:hypothetical protein
LTNIIERIVMKSPKAHSIKDYGWRLHGQPVRVLKDRSFRLNATGQPAAAALLSRYCADSASLMACLQCGMCTANCNLAEEGSLFPRRQMTFLQLGQKESLAAEARKARRSAPMNRGAFSTPPWFGQRGSWKLLWFLGSRRGPTEFGLSCWRRSKNPPRWKSRRAVGRALHCNAVKACFFGKHIGP